jgi:hypothetical protein
MNLIYIIKNIFLYFELKEKIKKIQDDIIKKYNYRVGPFLQIYNVFYLDENEFTGVDKIDIIKITDKTRDMTNYLVENGLKLDYTVTIDKIDERNYLVIFYPSFFKFKGWKVLLEILIIVFLIFLLFKLY